MHEMSLVRNVVDIVIAEADAAGAAEVTAVHIVIGEGRDIVLDYFEGLFQFLARGTVAEHAEMVVYSKPYMVCCNQCGFTFHLEVCDSEQWHCPQCEAYKDYKLVSGTEFYISKIEASGKTSEEADIIRKGETA